MEIAISVHGIPVRLPYERWYHIIENHDELASHFYDVLEVVENPDFVARGNRGTLKAVKNTGKDTWLVVVYKETSRTDGFIITAYFLGKKPKGEVIWRRK